MPNFKECFKPHALVHLITGAGIGFLIASLANTDAQTGLWTGVGLIVVAVIAEFMVNK